MHLSGALENPHELADRRLDVVVDDDIIEVAPMAHVADGIGKPPRDDLLVVGPAPAQASL